MHDICNHKDNLGCDPQNWHAHPLVHCLFGSELTNYTRLIGQQAPRIMSLPLQHWDYKHISCHHAQLFPRLLRIWVFMHVRLAVYWLNYLYSPWWGALAAQSSGQGCIWCPSIRQRFPITPNFLRISSKCSTGWVSGICLSVFSVPTFSSVVFSSQTFIGPWQMSQWSQRMWSDGLHLSLI